MASISCAPSGSRAWQWPARTKPAEKREKEILVPIPDGTPVFQRRLTAELIADHLREQIVLGIFRPGQQINEPGLAAQLQTSRGTLREGLQRLCQEGLLGSWRTRGFFVEELTTTDIEEIYAVRETIELSSADRLLEGGQGTLDGTTKALREIVSDMAKQVALSDWQEFARADMQFHTVFVAGAGNSRLIRIFQTVAAESRMCLLGLEVSRPRAGMLVEEHQVILDKLEGRDREGLQEAIRCHIQKAMEDLTA